MPGINLVKIMDKKAADHLCVVAGRIDAIADIYKIAKYWFLAKYADGFSCFAGKEAMERWKMSGKIHRYIASNGHVMPFPAHAPPKSTDWAGVNQVMSLLQQSDVGAMSAIRSTLRQLQTLGFDVEYSFLNDIAKDYQKEVSEIKRHVDHLTSPPELASMNQNLKEEYQEY